MIKVYRLKIADKVYEVEVESISEKEGSISATKPQAAQEVKQEAPVSSGNEIVVEAPMQGSIFEIVASVGDEVKAGDELIILEAMKMENPIVAPQAGKVVKILVSKGETVDTGKALVVLA